MTTAIEMVQSAMELIQVYAPGQTLTAADSLRGLNTLNSLLGKWSNEAHACYAITDLAIPLVSGKRKYTVGGVVGAESPNVVAVKPLRLLEFEGSAYVLASDGALTLVEIVRREVLNSLSSGTVPMGTPSVAHYERGEPWSTVHVYPSPQSSGGTLHLNSHAKLTNFATLETSISLPEGYKDAIEYNLAVRLWNYFKAGDPPQSLMYHASESLASIKRTNITAIPASFDDMPCIPRYFSE